jgi:hypothetical protein
MTWIIGLKSDTMDYIPLEVDVDECSPKEHYLYLYDQYEATEEEADLDKDGNIVELEPKLLAKIMGFFPPTTWVFAIKDEVIVVPDEPSELPGE